MKMRQIVSIVLLAIIAVVVLTGLFTVRETEQALVLQFGEPKRFVEEPGLHWKIPLVQNVEYFDKRILNLDVPEQEVIASDQKRLIVDAFARFRITDPLLTYQSVRSEQGARGQMSTLLQSQVRNILGDIAMREVVSGRRAELMGRIQQAVEAEADTLGINLVDVRLRRVDLPEANSQAIYARMRSEREREAAEARAEGREEAERIRAQAERERTVLLAEAERDSQRIRGTGDGEAVRIYANAFSQSPEFFEFYRTMEAYEKSLDGDKTTIILSPDSEFFKMLNTGRGDSGR